jgi:CRISPR/Cas system CMR-associated protein Cmr5 small subunit
MDKRKVDRLIEKAYLVLPEVGIVKEDKVERVWNGYISSFGAAIMQGSLLAAVSFFSKKSEKTVVDRSQLTKAIFKLIEDAEKKEQSNLFEYVQIKRGTGKEREAKEHIVHAAVALKLALNLYDLREEEQTDAKPENNEPSLSAE